MKIKAFFDKVTFTLTYVVYDPLTSDAVVIDPVWDYNPETRKTSTESISQICSYIRENQLRLHYSLETHAHADHLSGSQLIKDEFPDVQVAIGENITYVQKAFKQVFELPADFPADGSQFDILLKDGSDLKAGSLTISTRHTPGHTPACVCYLIGDAIFCGDVMFMPDYGTGRCDFPEGRAEDLYESITQKIYTMPDHTRIFVGHDYQPNNREVQFETTVAEQKEKNIQLNAKTTKEDFVEFRVKRDQTLRAPKLLFQSVQVNIAGGEFPGAKESQAILRIPVNVFRRVIEPSADKQLNSIGFTEV